MSTFNPSDAAAKFLRNMYKGGQQAAPNTSPWRERLNQLSQHLEPQNTAEHTTSAVLPRSEVLAHFIENGLARFLAEIVTATESFDDFFQNARHSLDIQLTERKTVDTALLPAVIAESQGIVAREKALVKLLKRLVGNSLERPPRIVFTAFFGPCIYGRLQPVGSTHTLEITFSQSGYSVRLQGDRERQKRCVCSGTYDQSPSPAGLQCAVDAWGELLTEHVSQQMAEPDQDALLAA